VNLIILLPIFLTLAFAVVLSNQLLQAAGVKSSSKFWTNIKSTFLISYVHNDLVKKYITKPLAGLFGKSDTSSEGLAAALIDLSNDNKVNILYLHLQHQARYNN
jgi:hypothetical protein